MNLKTISEKILGNRRFLIFLIFANLAGFFVGIHYYWEQLMGSSPLLWIVILDSPISVLLFALVCVMIYLRKRVPDILKFLASVYVIKYGIWTMLAIYLYWNTYVVFEDQVVGVLNLFLHFGMILEGIVLIPKIRPNKYNTLIVFALLLANDYFDYFLKTVTRIPGTHMNFLMMESFAATIVIIISIVIYQISTGSKSSLKL
ncbi:MAG: DUF1405 domain-containing protein [Candidatus Aenigmarchaeota archaeon]